MPPPSTISSLLLDINHLRDIQCTLYKRIPSVTIISSRRSRDLQASSVRMAAQISEVTKNMAKHLLNLVSETSKNLRMKDVADHFELLQELGSGSYGSVFMGRHKHSGQIVAVKMQAKEKTAVDNFLLEYGISLTLSCHPHIIQTHEIVFHTPKEFVFIQELAPAGTLQSIIKPKVGMQEDMVKRCVPQIASALEFIHSRGMVHRDLKLDNILLMDAECHHIKLADFGLARLQGTHVPTVSWLKPYTAPELLRRRPGDQLLLQSSLDMWSFGVLVFTALNGFFPWQEALGRDANYKKFAWWQMRKDPSKAPEKWKKVSVEARRMFWNLLSVNPSDRGSAMDILKYLHLPWKVEEPSEDMADIPAPYR
ncbi:serine/threonine-protein kinase SBK1-like [Leptodactylus fuscus]|uniref:serine/threonine-protein kinase SBK1-like n=1 Tax=Leptodactylus fuscus TaxID=238119 RepID=UPI003F4EC6C5